MSKFIARAVVTGVDSKSFIGISKKDPSMPNLEELAAGVAEVYNAFDAQGYDVVNLLPIAVGSEKKDGAVVVSYSVTRGALAVGRRRD